MRHKKIFYAQLKEKSMNDTTSCRVMFFFGVFCLGLGFVGLPAPPASAGETVSYPGVSLQTVNGEGDSLAPNYDVFGGKTLSLTGNTVTLNSGEVNYIYGAVSVTHEGGDTSDNAVIINGGAATGDVFGGASISGSMNNSVTISGGTVEGNVVGGNGKGTVTGNKVIMSGGTVNMDISGAGSDWDGEVTGNSVIISGGIVGGDIYAGWSNEGSATHNTLIISGAPDLSASTLYGGDGVTASDVFTGNTLNLHSANLAVTGLQNFQYLKFYVPAALGNNGKMLIVSDGADITGSIVNVGVEGSSSPLVPGDRIILIEAGSLTGTPINNTSGAEGMHGVTLKYLFDITAEGNQLIASLAKVTANEQAKTLSEGFLSGLIMLRQGGDLVAGQAIPQAVEAASRAEIPHLYGFGIFGTISGGWSRYDSGSHVDISSVSLLTGVSWGADLAPGRLTLGGFFEYGNGSYDTYNSFSNAASVHGDGDIYYLGGGVLGRMDFADTGSGRFYAEGDIRAGGVHNDFASSDLRDAQGRKAKYDASSTYYSAHTGAGYIWDLKVKSWLDLYSKYFWTRQEGDFARLSTADSIRFKSADSHRLRFGGRFAHAVHERVSPYIGAAYEHEFDGKVRASASGYPIDEPDLKGGTGIGETGLILPPSDALPLSFDLGVQGYTGKREGVSGSLQMKLEF